MDFNYYVQYFESLEARFVNIEKFVAFEEENLNVFSIEFASIINDCCGLINGFCTELCKQENPSQKEFYIKDFKKYIDKHFQKEQFVYCGNFILQPWEKVKLQHVDSGELCSPLWWKAYNGIKHSGKPNFIQATLKNAISCMAGMFALLVMYDYIQLGTTMSNWKGFFWSAGNCRKSVSWDC